MAGTYATGTNPFVTSNPYGQVSPATWQTTSYPVTFQTTQEEEVEYITGDGESTTFTFQTTSQYPEVRVFDREIEGEDEERTVTLTASKADVTIIQGESVTVRFVSPPDRRSVVILVK